MTAFVFKKDNLHMLIVNVYNQPRTFDGIEAMGATLRTLPPSILHLSTVVVTDSNIHSTIWNLDDYPTHDTTDDDLVEAMTKWNLYLRSPKGVLTFETPAGNSAGTTIDLVWVNQQADDLLIACLVNKEDMYNHHSDHRAMITVIKSKSDDGDSPEMTYASEKNWLKLNRAKFLSELKALLQPV